MNNMKKIALLFVLSLVLMAVPARGGLIFKFDAANYVGASGSTVDVTLQLEATDDSAAGGVDHTALFRTGGMDGLFSTGVFVLNDNFASATSFGASVSSTADININTTVFNDTGGAVGPPGLNFTTVGAGFAGVQAVVDDLVEGAQTAPSGATGPIIVDVATFTYSLGPVGEITNLRLLDFGVEDFNGNGILDAGEDLNANLALDIGGDDTNDVNGTVFDATPNLFAATATITATAAIPEPSSWILVCGLSVCFCRRRNRRA